MVLPQWEIFSDCAGSVNGSLAAKGELRTLSRSEGLVRGGGHFWRPVQNDQTDIFISKVSPFLPFFFLYNA